MERLNSLVGLASVKAGMALLRETVEFDLWRTRFFGNHSSLLGQSFHMQFLGNPGTGKTEVARIVGSLLVDLGIVKTEGEHGVGENLVFREVSRSDLVAGITGQTAPKVRKVVRSAYGGVLFIDEAYSLVQDRKDGFGLEALDTLMKEMEDHRDKVIVIFAGYRQQMETFFKANPGLKSRVPFSFEFSDYNCEELVDIFEQLLPKNITLGRDERAWADRVITATTGCCRQADRQCGGPSHDMGNGRAVRNILESALRRMAVRVVATATSGGVTKKLLSELNVSDVAGVGAEFLVEALRTSCKGTQQQITGIGDLVSASRVLSLRNFTEVLHIAREDCASAISRVQKAIPKVSVESAAAVRIEGETRQKIFEELEHMIGLDSIKGTVRELYCTVRFDKLRADAELPKLSSQTFHMRFLGNPGTGKTVVARIVGRLLVELGVIQTEDRTEHVFNEVSRQDLVAEYVGQTAIKTATAVHDSLGGILFVDEAYSLVGEGDRYGQEAVDTLIKEVEDKRRKVVIILAGYEAEMVKFFSSNPGFESRVPFVFHFEDYNCTELVKMGDMMLEQMNLTLPDSRQSYERAVSFGTDCCENLEGCKLSRDKGNGRALRNVVEAGVRAMANRLMLSSACATPPMYQQMKPEDFDIVMQQLVKARLAVPCGAAGDVRRIVLAVRTAAGMLEYELGLRREVLPKLRYVTENLARAETVGGLTNESLALVGSCHDLVETLAENITIKLHSLCKDHGVLDQLSELLHSSSPSSVGEAALMLSRTIEDQRYISELRAVVHASRALPAEARGLDSDCGHKVAAMQAETFAVPFAKVKM